VWERITSNNALATDDNLYTERELSLHGTSTRTTQLHVSHTYFDDIEDVSKIISNQQYSGLINPYNLLAHSVAYTIWVKSHSESMQYKNSSGDEIANVNFYAVHPEATRIRWNNIK